MLLGKPSPRTGSESTITTPPVDNDGTKVSGEKGRSEWSKSNLPLKVGQKLGREQSEVNCLSKWNWGGRKNGDVDGMRTSCAPSSSSNSTVHSASSEVCQSPNEKVRFEGIDSSLSTSESSVESQESLPIDVGENGRIETGEMGSC